MPQTSRWTDKVCHKVDDWLDKHPRTDVVLAAILDVLFEYPWIILIIFVSALLLIIF